MNLYKQIPFTTPRSYQLLLEQLQSERTTLQEQLDKLREQKRTLQQENQRLASELQEIRAEHSRQEQHWRAERDRLETELATLRQRLEQLQTQPSGPVEPPPEKESLQERYLRLHADLENMRRRQRSQLEQERTRIRGELVRDLLGVLDALYRARSLSLERPEQFQEGLAAIEEQLLGVLARQGVERIEDRQGAFDPQIHEAVTSVPSTEHPEGHIVELIRPGYRIGERLLRPAEVTVARAAGEEGGRS